MLPLRNANRWVFAAAIRAGGPIHLGRWTGGGGCPHLSRDARRGTWNRRSGSRVGLSSLWLKLLQAASGPTRAKKRTDGAHTAMRCPAKSCATAILSDVFNHIPLSGRLRYTHARRFGPIPDDYDTSKLLTEEAMNFKRVAATALAIVFTLTINPRSASASEQSDVTAAVHRYFDNLEKDKLETALAMCDSHVSILDEFPPHEWHGATACADWWKGLNAYDDKEGITDGEAQLGTPWTVDISGDRAYFVAPSTYTYKQHGKPVKESQAVFTVALKKTQAGWRITAWTWSKH